MTNYGSHFANVGKMVMSVKIKILHTISEKKRLNPAFCLVFTIF